MNIRTVLAALVFALLPALFGGCALRPAHPMDMAAAVRDARTPADHTALADHYEEAARAAEAKAREHRDLTNAYRSGSGGYGKQAAGWEAHCQAIAGDYLRIANENRQLAAMHRQIAAGAR